MKDKVNPVVAIVVIVVIVGVAGFFIMKAGAPGGEPLKKIDMSQMQGNMAPKKGGGPIGMRSGGNGAPPSGQMGGPPPGVMSGGR